MTFFEGHQGGGARTHSAATRNNATKHNTHKTKYNNTPKRTHLVVPRRHRHVQRVVGAPGRRLVLPRRVARAQVVVDRQRKVDVHRRAAGERRRLSAV